MILEPLPLQYLPIAFVPSQPSLSGHRSCNKPLQSFMSLAAYPLEHHTESTCGQYGFQFRSSRQCLAAGVPPVFRIEDLRPVGHLALDAHHGGHSNGGLQSLAGRFHAPFTPHIWRGVGSSPSAWRALLREPLFYRLLAIPCRASHSPHQQNGPDM